MHENADPRLIATEAALRSLLPTPAGIDRDRLMYDAGRSANRRRGWPAAAGFFAVLSAFLAVRGISMPEPTAPERIVVTAPPASTPPSGEQRVGAKRNQSQPTLVEVLLSGVPDSLPPDRSRERQIDLWLRGGPADIPYRPAISRPLNWFDDSIDPIILRRGRL